MEYPVYRAAAPHLIVETSLVTSLPAVTANVGVWCRRQKTLQATSLRLGPKSRDDVLRFRALRVVLVGRCVKHSSIMIQNVGRWNRQLPTFISVRKRQIHEGLAVNVGLEFRHAIG